MELILNVYFLFYENILNINSRIEEIFYNINNLNKYSITIFKLHYYLLQFFLLFYFQKFMSIWFF